MPADETQGAQWYRQAAEQGYEPAMYWLFDEAERGNKNAQAQLAVFSAKTGNATLTGKYMAVARLNEKDEVVLDIQEKLKQEGFSADAMHIEFLSNGKCKQADPGGSAELTFKVYGNFVTIPPTNNTKTLKGIIEGNKITFSEENGTKMVFVKP